MPPSIVITGNNTAIIEGAVASKALELLIVEAKKLNIKVTVDASVPWAVPIIGLYGQNFNQLSENLAWKCTNAISLEIDKAPVCWSAEKRDMVISKMTIGRTVDFPVFIFHVWDAATPFSVFPVQRGEDHSDKFRGGSVSLKNQAYTPALRQRHPSAPAFSVLHHKGRYAGTERKVPRHRSEIPPWKNPFSFLLLLPVPDRKSVV